MSKSRRDQHSSLSDQLSQLVYSTDQGRINPEPAAESLPEGDGIVRLRRESKGRKGKGVTLIDGLLVDTETRKKITKQLKQRCGVGGAVKGSIIEIQGDQRESIKQWLTEQGYRVKLAGG